MTKQHPRGKKKEKLVLWPVGKKTKNYALWAVFRVVDLDHPRN